MTAACLAALLAAEGLILIHHGMVREWPGGRELFAAESAARSPDGRAIAFVAGERRELLLHADGRTTTLLRHGGPVAQPAWSPRGDSIACVAGDTLYVLRPDGSGVRALARGAFIFGVVWHPDGRRVLYHDMRELHAVSETGAEGETTRLGAITGNPDAVTSSDRFVPNPAKPSLLAFTRAVSGTATFEGIFHEPNTALYTWDAVKRLRRRVTAPEVTAFDPAWSRDGRYLYFSGFLDRQGRENDPHRIFRIAADGAGLAELARGEQPCP